MEAGSRGAIAGGCRVAIVRSNRSRSPPTMTPSTAPSADSASPSTGAATRTSAPIQMARSAIASISCWGPPTMWPTSCRPVRRERAAEIRRARANT